jgi:hypothetical protein
LTLNKKKKVGLTQAVKGAREIEAEKQKRKA